MNDCLISFGSNLGDSKKTISSAIDQLKRDLQSEESENICFQVSRFLVTRPIGGPGNQSSFINGVVRFKSSLSPLEIFERLQATEKGFGRERRVRWDSRTLDLDLLLYGSEIFEFRNLVVPHPRMSFRQFVLQPALDVAPDKIHPVCGATIKELTNCLVSRPKDILICGENDFLDQVDLEGQGIQSRVDRISKAALIDSFEQSTYKLIVVLDSPDGQGVPALLGEDWISRHRGPILYLDQQDPAKVRIELLAAIEAMKEI